MRPSRPLRGANIAATLSAIVYLGCAPLQAQERYGAPSPDLKDRLSRLVEAYPDWIRGFDDRDVIMKDGRRFAVSDGRANKTFTELIEHPDIDDMFYARYPAGAPPQPPERNSDPGRVRFEPLFVAMYGDCHAPGFAARIRSVAWLPRHGGGSITVTTVNGVDRAVEAVSRELDALPKSFAKFLRLAGGGFNCRNVAGSGARSMHAYGAAVDIGGRFTHYWRWARSAGPPRWRNRLPIEIVRIFERHGFIWGGAWYHYDTMHFEYRPELLPAPSSGRGAN